MKSMTSPAQIVLIALLGLGITGLAAAQTQQDPRLAQLADNAGCKFPAVPSIPAAEGATMEQMVATQGAIQSYIAESNELLDCLDAITKDTDLAEPDRQLALDAYNAEVSNQETLAENWNVQRTRFLELQQK